MSRYTDVQDFLYKFKIRQNKNPDLVNPIILEKRFDHMQEELLEFMYSKNCDDLHGMVDALIDLIYVAYGTASILGLDEEKFNACFDAVHTANMSKILDMSDTTHKIGVKKPLGWVAPDFTEILRGDNNEI